VCTRNGPVRGYLENVDGVNVAVFKGIPYAEPPIGNLRWKAPVPLARRWITPFDATRIGAVCPPGLLYPDPYNRTISEDCLTINVWVPIVDDPNEKLPILNWIHGGAFVEGAPEAFGVGDFSLYAATHRTIVVSASYRVNALGFFSSDLLAGHSEPEARGVFGMYDQRLALQWTQANIGNFGGDKTKVTIYGQSAGGISVCLQSVTPLNDAPGGKLFRSAFSSSGYCTTLPETNNQADDNLIASLGCTGNLTCLLNAPWEAIKAAVGDSFLSFQPTVGVNNFLTKQPITLLAERAVAVARGDRTIFMPEFYARGSTADEGTFLLDNLFPGLSDPDDPNGPSQPVVDYITIGLGGYSSEFYYEKLAPLYSTQYNPNVSSPGSGLIDNTNDIMLCSVRRDLAYFSLATSAHGWFFDSAPATAEYPAWVGAFHEADVFYVARHADGIWVTNLTRPQLELGSKMDVYWDSVVRRASVVPKGFRDPLNYVPLWTSFDNGHGKSRSVMRFTARGEGKGPMEMVAYNSLTNHGDYYYHQRCDQLDKILADESGVPAMNPAAYLAANMHH
jgi:carboxylesterase type B